MKVINLDKMRKVQVVQIGGVEYEIHGVTVGMFLNDNQFEKLMVQSDNPEEIKQNVKILIQILTSISNIPDTVLEKQPFEILNALMAVAQGQDPTKDIPDEEAKSDDVKN